MSRLYHGDCLEIMKDIPDKSIDFILTDQPYGTTACKWDVIIPFNLMWKELNRVIKDNGAIALFGSEPFSSHLRLSNLKMFKYDWIWNKKLPSGFQTAKYMPMKKHEIISIFNGKTYYPIKTPQKIRTGKPYSKSDSSPLKYNDGLVRQYMDKNPQSILEFYKRDIVSYHPTQKPVALLEYLIKTYTLEGETVLDFTMGSGSTGVACKNLNRKFIGIEKDETYFNIAKQRLGLI